MQGSALQLFPYKVKRIFGVKPCKQHFHLAGQFHSPYSHISVFKNQFVHLVDLEVHKQVNLDSRGKETRTLLDSFQHCCVETVLLWEVWSVLKTNVSMYHRSRQKGEILLWHQCGLEGGGCHSQHKTRPVPQQFGICLHRSCACSLPKPWLSWDELPPSSAGSQPLQQKSICNHFPPPQPSGLQQAAWLDQWERWFCHSL